MRMTKKGFIQSEDTPLLATFQTQELKEQSQWLKKSESVKPILLVLLRANECCFTAFFPSFIIVRPRSISTEVMIAKAQQKWNKVEVG